MLPIIALGLLLWGCSEDEEQADAILPTEDTDAHADSDSGVADATQPDTLDAIPADSSVQNQQLAKIREVEVPGTPDTLFAAVDGCFAITNTGDSYQLIKTGIDGTSAVVQNNLPGLGQRIYGTSLRLANGMIAATYQSTVGYPTNSDGSHQGLILLTSDGQLVADYEFGDYGATRPSALIEMGGKLLVLANNCEVALDNQGQVVCQKDASIFSMDISAPQTPDIQKTDLFELRNASAMGLRNNNNNPELVVAAAGDYNINPEGTSILAVIDPESLQVTKTVESIKGLGLNGNAPVSANDDILFTGQAATGESLALFNGIDLTKIKLPDSVTNPYVAAAAFFNNDILFNTADWSTGNISNYQFDLSTQTAKDLGETIKGQFNLPFVSIDGSNFCSGVAGHRSNETGKMFSKILFWSQQ